MDKESKLRDKYPFFALNFTKVEDLEERTTDFLDRLVIDLINNFYTGCSKNVVAITADQAIIIGQPVQQGCPKIILSLKKPSML